MKFGKSSRIERFVGAVIGQHDSGQLETRQFKSAQKPLRNFHSTGIEFLQSVWGGNQHTLGLDQFFGVGLRHNRDGTKRGVRTIGSLWADLDGKNYKGGKGEALLKLRDFALQPAFIIDSGNGLHAYWLLNEPHQVENLQDRALFESYLKRLAISLGADSAVAEVARVMRIPGTYNWKNPSNPLPVSFVTFEPNRRLRLSEFDDVIGATEALEPIKSKDLGWVATTLSNMQNGNRNISLTRVAGKLRYDGWGAEEIIALLGPHAQMCEFPTGELRGLVAGICARYQPNDSVSVSPIYREETETETKAYTAISISELVSADIPEISWVVEPFLPSECVAILSAPGGHGKTWGLLDLAIECATGGKWLGHFGCSSGNVLYIDEESTIGLLKRRLSKLLRAKGKVDSEVPIMFTVQAGLSINDDTEAVRLGNLLRENCPTLVIVDCLIRVNQADENSSVEMAKFFSRIKKLTNEFGCSFIFADHQRKPGVNKSSPDMMLRGSTEKVAFIDSLICFSKKDERIFVKHAKSRYCEALSSFVIELTDTCDGGSEFSYIGAASKVLNEDKIEKSANVVMELLNESWISRKDLIETAKDTDLSTKLIDKALKYLTENGSIQKDERNPETGRGRKSAYYKVAGDSGGDE